MTKKNETSKTDKAMQYEPVLGDVITGKCCDDHYIHKGKIKDIWISGAVTIECGEDCPKKIKYPDRYHGKSSIIYKHNIRCDTCKYILPKQKCSHPQGCEADYELWEQKTAR